MVSEQRTVLLGEACTISGANLAALAVQTFSSPALSVPFAPLGLSAKLVTVTVRLLGLAPSHNVRGYLRRTQL